MTKIIPTDRWIEYRLEKGDRPRSVYEFYVTGRGTFPLDMLRYDCCWPMSGVDTANMDGTYPRTVRLRSYREPTPARWSSFVWFVSRDHPNRVASHA